MGTFSARGFCALCFCRFLNRALSCSSAMKCAPPSRLCTPAPGGLRTPPSQVKQPCWNRTALGFSLTTKTPRALNSSHGFRACSFERVRAIRGAVCLAEPHGPITFPPDRIGAQDKGCNPDQASSSKVLSSWGLVRSPGFPGVLVVHQGVGIAWIAWG